MHLNRENRKNVKALLLGLGTVVLVLIVFFLCSGRSLFHVDKPNEAKEPKALNSYEQPIEKTDTTPTETDSFFSDEIEEEDEDAIESIPPSKYLGKRVSKAYDKVIGKYSAIFIDEFQCQCDSFLYDITRDGRPELWLLVGTCEANYRLHVYTYRHGKTVKICDRSGFHAGFYRGKNYIIQTMMHMGVNEWYKLTYANGKIREKKIYHQEVEDVDDFVYPKEPEKRMSYCY